MYGLGQFPGAFRAPELGKHDLHDTGEEAGARGNALAGREQSASEEAVDRGTRSLELYTESFAARTLSHPMMLCP